MASVTETDLTLQISKWFSI